MLRLVAPIHAAEPLEEGAAPENTVDLRDRAAFERAVLPLLPRLERFCLALARNRAEAEDVLQEGLIRAWQHADSFEGRCELYPWLCSILRNHFLEVRRVAVRRRGLLDAVLQGAAEVLGTVFSGGAESLDPEGYALHNEQAALLLRCLHTLREEFRTVVFLCDVEGLSYEEVSRVVGAPLGTIKSRHARGRERLARAYSESHDSAPRSSAGAP